MLLGPTAILRKWFEFNQIVTSMKFGASYKGNKRTKDQIIGFKLADDAINISNKLK